MSALARCSGRMVLGRTGVRVLHEKQREHGMGCEKRPGLFHLRFNQIPTTIAIGQRLLGQGCPKGISTCACHYVQMILVLVACHYVQAM